MFKFLTVICIFLVFVGLFFFGSRGCESIFPQERVYVEQDDEAFKRGQEFVAAGRDADAMEAFSGIIRRHPDSSSESNFEMGLLAFKQNNYPLAIYHFNQYLSLRLDASPERRRRAVGLINSSKKRFLQEMLPGRSEEPASAGISPVLEEKYRAVMRQNEALKLEIAQLKNQLARASAVAEQTGTLVPAVGVPVVSQTETSNTVELPPLEKPSVPATHTVVAGDTLSGISKKYYGTPARWREIYEANRVTMSSPSALKIGMVLKLPRP